MDMKIIYLDFRGLKQDDVKVGDTFADTKN